MNYYPKITYLLSILTLEAKHPKNIFIIILLIYNQCIQFVKDAHLKMKAENPKVSDIVSILRESFKEENNMFLPICKGIASGKSLYLSQRLGNFPIESPGTL